MSDGHAMTRNIMQRTLPLAGFSQVVACCTVFVHVLAFHLIYHRGNGSRNSALRSGDLVANNGYLSVSTILVLVLVLELLFPGALPPCCRPGSGGFGSALVSCPSSSLSFWTSGPIVSFSLPSFLVLLK